MRCEKHCPPDAAWFPVGAVVAVLAVLAAVPAAAVLIGDVVYVALVAEGVACAAGAVLVWRKLRPEFKVRTGTLKTEIANSRLGELAAAERRALPVTRPVVEGVVVHDGERIRT